MIESKTKAKITPEERKWWLSEIYSSFIDFAKFMGVFLGVIYLLIMLLLWVIKEPEDDLYDFIPVAVMGFAVHFGVYVFFLARPALDAIAENLEVIKGDKIVLVGKPTKLYRDEGGSESLDYYYIVFDEIKLQITARQYDKLQNATRVEVHYTPKKQRVLKIA